MTSLLSGAPLSERWPWNSYGSARLVVELAGHPVVPMSACRMCTATLTVPPAGIESGAEVPIFTEDVGLTSVELVESGWVSVAEPGVVKRTSAGVMSAAPGSHGLRS